MGQADVNGTACSIELYLGRDDLTHEEGTLPHQGEVVAKATLQQAFQAKLRAAVGSPSVMATQDWSGLRAVFAMLLTSFH